ncbi:MAG: TetR/AcrR family transcriptional regulator [Vulcanimicrobiaceae bacterium]
MARMVTERADALPALTEIFREHGYEGASLSLITEATGLGKGSLYHFFPGGKEEMVCAVLDEIDTWFETNVFAPLRTAPNPCAGVAQMMKAVEMYFRSGRRVCLVGVLALGDARDRFADRVRAYFSEWTDALADALIRAGRKRAEAAGLAEGFVAGIQGALVLARALDDARAFSRAIKRLEISLAL